MSFGNLTGIVQCLRGRRVQSTMSLVPRRAAFSHIVDEAACGWPLFQENCLIFHMLPFKFSFEQTLWQILDA